VINTVLPSPTGAGRGNDQHYSPLTHGSRKDVSTLFSHHPREQEERLTTVLPSPTGAGREINNCSPLTHGSRRREY